MFTRLMIITLLLLGLSAGDAVADPWNKVLGAGLQGAADEMFEKYFAPRWRQVMETERADPLFKPGGVANLPRPYMDFWKNLMKQVPTMSSLEKLRAISGFVNVQLNGKPDQVSYGLGEYWAPPREFVKNHGGDCEDFAICKYFALRGLGFAAGDLRLLLVEIPSHNNRWHALLAARINGEIYIVDNNFQPRDLALPHERLSGLFVLRYAFNEDGAWLYKASTRP